MAALFAIKTGLADGRTNRPPYLLIRGPVGRLAHKRQARKAVV